MVRVPGNRSRSSGVECRSYQILWKVLGLERGLLSVVRIIEEILERKVAVPFLQTVINRHRDPLHWPRDTPIPKKVTIKFADQRLPLGQLSSLCRLKPMTLFCFCLLFYPYAGLQSYSHEVVCRLIFQRLILCNTDYKLVSPTVFPQIIRCLSFMNRSIVVRGLVQYILCRKYLGQRCWNHVSYLLYFQTMI
jgi:hypothetical protein